MRSFSYILFLSLICNFAYGQAIIKGINYDESKVPDFVLPDPLICNDGQQVTTADEWEKVRRPEILEIFMSKVYGRTPTDKIDVSYTLLACDPKAMDGKATCKQILFTFTNGKKTIDAILLLYIPNHVQGRVPVFVGYNFMGEMSFLIIGLLGFVWMGVWVFVYKDPRENPHVNAAELAYIEQDADNEKKEESNESKSAGDSGCCQKGEKSGEKRALHIFEAFRYRQTWAVIFGRFLPDSVWWFLLFWAPAFISEVYGYSTSSTIGMVAIFTIYFISMASTFGSYLPTFFINRDKMNPYAGRMKAMLVFAFFPLLGLGVMPLGRISLWFPVVIIGIMAAAHQSWSANVYNVVSDMFPKSVVATVTGAAGLASGLGSFMSNYGAGQLFSYAAATHMNFLGFEGKNAGYMIVFMCAGLAYLLSWCIMKLLVPEYKIIELKK